MPTYVHEHQGAPDGEDGRDGLVGGDAHEAAPVQGDVHAEVAAGEGSAGGVRRPAGGRRPRALPCGSGHAPIKWAGPSSAKRKRPPTLQVGNLLKYHA